MVSLFSKIEREQDYVVLNTVRVAYMVVRCTPHGGWNNSGNVTCAAQNGQAIIGSTIYPIR